MPRLKRLRSAANSRVRHVVSSQPERSTWKAHYLLVALCCSIVTALIGWLSCTVVIVVGWIAAGHSDLLSLLQASTKAWLLVHSMKIYLAAGQISVTPLGATFLLIWLGVGIIHLASGHCRDSDHRIGLRVLEMTAVFALSYGAFIAIGAAWTQSVVINQIALVKVICIVAVVAGWAFSTSMKLPWCNRSLWPEWLRSILAALSAGMATMIVFSAVALTIAVAVNYQRITLIHDSINAGVIGGIMMLVLELAWLPTMILWTGAWISGAGIQIGLDTVISPVHARVGMLPAFPFTGALPSAGQVPSWMLIWLLSGVVSGMVAAWVMSTRMIAWYESSHRVSGQLWAWLSAYRAKGDDQPSTSEIVADDVDELENVDAVDSSLLGEQERDSYGLGVEKISIWAALAGICTGLTWTLSQWMATGDLGVSRLVNLGGRMEAVAIMSPSIMGFAALCTGWIMGIVYRMRHRQRVDEVKIDCDGE